MDAAPTGNPAVPDQSLATVPNPKYPDGASWAFTINNYDEETIERFRKLLVARKVQRLIIGREIGPENGVPHLQGYVRFDKPCRFSWWKNQFPTAHVERTKGNETQNATYCSKGGDVVIDHGKNCDELRTAKRDRETETDQIIDQIERGARIGDLMYSHKRFMFWNGDKVVKYRQRWNATRKDENWEEYPCRV